MHRVIARSAGSVAYRSPREILGVGQKCTEDEVKLAFRQCAKRLHPDVQPPGADKEGATRKFRELEEAYRHLRRELKGSQGTKRAVNHNAYKTSGTAGGTATRRGAPPEPRALLLFWAKVFGGMFLFTLFINAGIFLGTLVKQRIQKQEDDNRAKLARLRQERAQLDHRNTKSQ